MAKNNLDEEINDEIDREENGPEDLCDMLNKTEIMFRQGNNSVNKYDLSPKDILDEYQDFN